MSKPLAISFKAKEIFSLTLIIGVAVLCAQQVSAAPNKCVGPGGKIEYTDGPCPANTSPKPLKAKPVPVVSSESLTGQPAKPKDERPAWLKEANETFDPIAKCKARGGTIDVEMRACKLP